MGNKLERRMKSVSVSRDTHRQIKEHTNKTGESLSGFISGLIDSHLDEGRREPFPSRYENPPRVYLSCVAPKGEEVDTGRDVKLGIGSRGSMPLTESLRMKVTVDSGEIMLTTELLLDDLCLDMPTTLIDEDGVETVGRVTVDASTISEFALHPARDFESLRINGRDDIYAKSIEFTCLPEDGDHVTKLVVHTIKPRGKMTTDEPT